MNQAKFPIDLILKKVGEERKTARTRMKKASNVLTSQLDTEISTPPYDIVYEEDRVKLKHYRPKEIRVKTPLLIIYALINRETMLDLQPKRSVIETFLNQGIEIFMIDWGYPSRKDQFQTIGDHVNGYIANIVDFICVKKNIARINIMGICMGGVFSIIYSALFPHKVLNLLTTVTPTNFDTDKGLLNIWMKQTDAQVLGDVYANMPGDVMNLGFLLLNPARLMIDKYISLMQYIDDKNFVRMEKWIFDSPDVPAATVTAGNRWPQGQEKKAVCGRTLPISIRTLPEYSHMESIHCQTRETEGSLYPLLVIKKRPGNSRRFPVAPLQTIVQRESRPRGQNGIQDN